MKIGILTFYESENYGTVLQAYALQKFLQDCGHDVEIIKAERDVHGKGAHNKIEREKETFIDKVRIKLNSYLSKNQAVKKTEAFKDFRKKFINESSKAYSEDNKEWLDCYDLLISGGDQIWNPYHKVFSMKYFFENVKAKKISFGSSFGTDDLSVEFLSKIKPCLLDYKAVSVREPSAVKLLESVLVSATSVLDPVFLLSKEQWLSLAKPEKPKKPYCLVYSLVDYTTADQKAIKKYAKENGLKVKIFPQNRKNLNNNFSKEFSASPEEFLSLIYNAERVFTNSFHGTAFSIIFNKQFSILNPSNEAMRKKLVRITDLTSLLSFGDLDFMEIKELDYQRANEIIEEKTKNSKDFLLNNILRGEE